MNFRVFWCIKIILVLHTMLKIHTYLFNKTLVFILKTENRKIKFQIVRLCYAYGLNEICLSVFTVKQSQCCIFLVFFVRTIFSIIYTYMC